MESPQSRREWLSHVADASERDVEILPCRRRHDHAQWFAPTDKGEDLDFARQLINGAEQGILFLFFNPGAFEPDDKPEMWTLLQNILVRHQSGTPNYNPNLYIHGVVNQEIAGLTTENPTKPNKKHAALDPATPSPVKLFDGGNTAPQAVPYESMVPKAIKDAFHDWMAEVMNQGVHVHSKVIVIDPFGKKPVVITDRTIWDTRPRPPTTTT